VVVRGGPGNNPAVGDIVEAVAAAPADSVFVLPNHRNVVPAAERAAAESPKDVRVIPTRSVPEGLAAAAAFNPLQGPDENEVFVREAASGAAAAEVTRAIRDADTPAGPVRTGQWLGVAGGTIREVGDDPAAVAAKVVATLRTEAHEILTLVVGSEATDAEARSVEAALREALPGLEVEVHDGGQPGYPFLIGLE